MIASFGIYEIVMLVIGPSIRCDKGFCLFYETICSWIFIIVSLIVTPCGFAHPFSRKKRDKVGEVKQYLDRFSWLFIKYRSVEVCYWEMLIVLRKVLLVLIAKFLTTKAIISMPLQMAVLLISMCLQYKYKPYTNDCEDEDATGQFYNDANNRLEMF